MKNEFLQSLKNYYGSLIPEDNYQKAEGIYIGEGWYGLLEQMCVAIRVHESNISASKHYRESLGIEDINDYDPVEILQIKEKFAQMRCFYRGGDQYTSGIIAMTEAMSSIVCEKCGNKGEIRDFNWMRTLCDQHYKERLGAS